VFNKDKAMINPFLDLSNRLSNIEKLLQELSAQNDHSNKHQEELLSKKQTCSLLGISQSTLWRWTQDKRLQAYGLNNRVYYKRSEIIATIKKIN